MSDDTTAGATDATDATNRDDTDESPSPLSHLTVLVLCYFGVNNALAVTVGSVLRAGLVSPSTDLVTNAVFVVAAGVTVVLVRRKRRPSVARVWAFSLVTSLAMTTVTVFVDGAVPELSGSLYPVLRQSLLAVAALSFAGALTWPGTLGTLRSYVDPLSDVRADERREREAGREQ